MHCLTFGDAEPDEILSLPFYFLPVVPDVIPQPIARPTVDLFEFSLNASHTEIIQPSPVDFFQLRDAFGKGSWYRFPCNLFQAHLEFIPVLPAYYQLVFAPVSFLVRGHKLVSADNDDQADKNTKQIKGDTLPTQILHGQTNVLYIP